MRLEKYSEEKLKKQILEIASKHLDLSQYKVFFFGSRVFGGGSDRSDIDLGIEGKNPVPIREFENIKEEIEEIPILYKVELVDFKKVSPEFYNFAKKSIEIINP
ncbi:MAG: nucleotidyltransferase domain-containing protein [bacterium]